MSADDGRRVRGYCPMGCGQTLFLGDGGYVTCSLIGCPQPDAVATLLEDSEHEHIVKIEPGDFTILHPLRERLGDQLMSCDLMGWLSAQSGPPFAPGRYRVYLDVIPPGRWVALPPEPVEEQP